MSPVSSFALPLGMLQLALIGVILVLILKWIFGSKNAGKTIAAILIAGTVMVVVMIGFFGLALVTRTSVTRNHVTHQEALIAPEKIEAQSFRSDSFLVEVEQQDEKAAEIQAAYDETVSEVSQRVLGEPLVPGPEDPPNTGRSQVTKTTGSTPAYGQVLIAGSPWTDDVEEHQGFVADRYPSLESAAEALGRQVGGELLQHVSVLQSSEATPVYVWMHTNIQEPATREGALLMTRPVLEQVAEGIRQQLENPAGVSVERPASDEAIIVRVSTGNVTFDNHNKWRKYAVSGSGFVLAQVETPGYDFSLQQTFDQVPWVEDPARFAKEFRGGHWMLAYSEGTHTSHEEARRAAINAAAEILIGQADARVSQMSQGDIHRFAQKRESDPDWLRDRIADELASRNHATDQFTQRFDRPYGTVWREAILIDAEPGMMDRITDSLVGSLDAQASHHRATWFSYFALGGLILGTYVLLNTATKGYYAMSLGLVAAAGLIGAIFLMRMVGFAL